MDKFFYELTKNNKLCNTKGGHFMADVNKQFIRIWEEVESKCMRILFVGFYFSILLPFGVVVRLFVDPLRRHANDDTYWESYPSDDVKSDVERRQS